MQQATHDLGLARALARPQPSRRHASLKHHLSPPRVNARRRTLVRGEGRGVSDQYGASDAACPLNTRVVVGG